MVSFSSAHVRPHESFNPQVAALCKPQIQVNDPSPPKVYLVHYVSRVKQIIQTAELFLILNTFRIRYCLIKKTNILIASIVMPKSAPGFGLSSVNATLSLAFSSLSHSSLIFALHFLRVSRHSRSTLSVSRLYTRLEDRTTVLPFSGSPAKVRVSSLMAARA